MEIEALLPKRCRGKDVRPEWAVECAAEIVRAEALLASDAVTLCIGKRHGRMAAESELIAAGLEDTLPTVHEIKNFTQFGWKIRNRIAVEAARNPKVFIQYRFEVSRDHGLGNRTDIMFAATRQCRLKPRAIEVSPQSVPTQIQQFPKSVAIETSRSKTIQRASQDDAGTGKRKFREKRQFTLGYFGYTRLRGSALLVDQVCHDLALAGCIAGNFQPIPPNRGPRNCSLSVRPFASAFQRGEQLP